MRTHKNQTAEDMAKEYYETNKFRADSNSYKGFIAGYKQKTAEIQNLIEKLQLTKLEYNQSSGVSAEAVKNYNAEQDRKIGLLKILL